MKRTKKPIVPAPAYKQAVVWVPETKELLLPKEAVALHRVWTLSRHRDQATPPSPPIAPESFVGATLERFMHDWALSRFPEGLGVRYFARTCEHSVWVLLEYS